MYEERIMKKLLNPRLLVLIGTLLCLSVGVFGQNPRPEDIRQGERFQPGQPAEQRPNLLQELGLSPEQVQAVRRINQQRKPVEQAARQRFQEAQRALNFAIYGDNVDDANMQAKLSEFQAAQAELARIKFTNELAVRKVLTPDQLVKFRELRRRFAEARETLKDAPLQRPVNRPLRRLRRGIPPPLN
jgi:Spy/CpxP family protein refolding chaperone